MSKRGIFNSNTIKLLILTFLIFSLINDEYQIDRASSNIPVGAIKINATLEDSDSWEEDFGYTTTDMLEINLTISTSAVRIKLSKGVKTIKTWEDVTIRFHKKIAFTQNNTYHLTITNPGLKAGEDELNILGYYTVVADAADQALITLNASPIPWNFTFVEILGLGLFLSILRKKGHHNICE